MEELYTLIAISVITISIDSYYNLSVIESKRKFTNISNCIAIAGYVTCFPWGERDPVVFYIDAQQTTAHDAATLVISSRECTNLTSRASLHNVRTAR